MVIILVILQALSAFHFDDTSYKIHDYAASLRAHAQDNYRNETGNSTYENTTVPSDETRATVEFTIYGDRGPSWNFSSNIAPFTIDKRALGQNIVLRMIGEFYPYPNATMVNLSKPLSIPVLRIPGGAISDEVWFDRNNSRSWDTGKGAYPLTLRADHLDALVNFSRLIGAEPLFTVNLKRYNPGMAADIVRYCNVEKGYGIRYWEIGQEPDLYESYRPYSVSQYVNEFENYSIAMKAVDPTILLMGSSTTLAGRHQDWNIPLIQRMRENLSFVVVHQYALWSEQNDTSLPDYPTIENMLAFYPSQWTQHGVTYPSLYPRTMYNTSKKYSPAVKVAVTEYASASAGRHNGTGGGVPGISDSHAYALYAAETASRFMENRVSIANQWLMHSTSDQKYTLLDGDYNPRPAYYAFLMLAKWYGTTALAARSSDEARLSIHASYDDANSELCILAINKEPYDARTAKFDIRGFTLAHDALSGNASANVWTMSAPSLNSTSGANINGVAIDNSDVESSIAQMLPQVVNMSNGGYYTFPRASITLIRVKCAENATFQPIPTPTMLEPQDCTNLMQKGVTLRASAVANPNGHALSYEFQLDSSPSFASARNYSLDKPEVFEYWLSNNTAYYWRVRASDGRHASDWSAARTFNYTIPKNRDTNPPKVVSFSPTGDNVSINSSIVIQFSEAINESAIKQALSCSPAVEGQIFVEGNMTWFVPSMLEYNTTYNISLNSLTDEDGNLMANFSFNFTTELNLTLPEPPRVIGKVVSSSEECNFSIEIRDSDGGSVGLEYVDSSGEFSIALLPAAYMLVFSDGKANKSVEVNLTEGKNVDIGTIELPKPEFDSDNCSDGNNSGDKTDGIGAQGDVHDEGDAYSWVGRMLTLFAVLAALVIIILLRKKAKYRGSIKKRGG